VAYIPQILAWGVYLRRTIAFLIPLLVAAPLSPASAAEPSDQVVSESVDSGQVADSVGLADATTGIWHLRGAGGTVHSFSYGNPGDFPFMGDWNCDGTDTPGLYRQSDGFVYLRNSNTQGIADIRFFLGNPGDVPLAGDFDANGCDTISVYRPAESRIYVVNVLGEDGGGLGAADLSYVFGNPGDKPFVGDFNGDGTDTVGLHRESTGLVYFRDSLTTGIADHSYFYGNPGDRLVAGDWGIVDNVDSPALFRPSTSQFLLRYTNTQGVADEVLSFGDTSMLPVAGSWRLPGDSFLLVGAGDITGCDDAGSVTAALLDQLVAQHPDSVVFVAGDLAYGEGTPEQFAQCYDPTWGRHKERTRPSPGNHEYGTPGATGYFDYFGAAAGTPGQGYYSYQAGSWHVVVLNSNCGDIGGCEVGSPQELWLRQDLAASRAACTLAYWHHPLFSSGTHGGEASVQPLFSALYDHGAEVVINGHDHDYERFAPQDPEGNRDPVRGIREFVAGTGGRGIRSFEVVVPNSEARLETFGVLALRLYADGYDWEFVPEPGSTSIDVGTGSCH
jgi:hypothetical protein